MAALVRNYLEVYWPCAGGLSAVNAIGTQLRDAITSGLTRSRMGVLNKQLDAAVELGRNPVSKHQLSMEMSRLTQDETAELVLRYQILIPIHFPCSIDHEQDRQPYPVDPYYSS